MYTFFCKIELRKFIVNEGMKKIYTKQLNTLWRLIDDVIKI